MLNADPDPVTDPRPDPVPGPGPSLTEIKGEITNRLLRGGKGGGGECKGLLGSKRRWDWCKFILKDLIKVHLLGFLALGFSLLVDKFGSPGSGPDPHIGGGSGSGSGGGNECGSMQVRSQILNTAGSSLFIPE